MKVKGFSRMFCFAANMVEPHLKDLSQRFQMHRDVKSLVECADDVSEHGPANDDIWPLMIQKIVLQTFF